MKYLIKDLARISGLTPARIRKWQQRYEIFRPEAGDNGYHYYTNVDLLVLTHIKRGLEEGRSLRDIIGPGRDDLISTRASDVFQEGEVEVLALIAAANFESMRRMWDCELGKLGFERWVAEVIHPAAKLVGKGWEEGYISVAEEHAWSRWMFGYFAEKLKPWESDTPADVLVITYPGEEHELGALLQYGMLLSAGRRAKFCGNMPEKDVVRELISGDYQVLSVSLVIPRRTSELNNFRRRIQQRFADLEIRFGGEGLSEGEQSTNGDIS